MRKINLVQIALPCHSLDCVLTPNRTLVIEKIIADALNDYRLEFGMGLEVISGYSMANGKVRMELYQLPRGGSVKVNVRAFSINQG